MNATASVLAACGIALWLISGCTRTAEPPIPRTIAPPNVKAQGASKPGLLTPDLPSLPLPDPIVPRDLTDLIPKAVQPVDRRGPPAAGEDQPLHQP